jgi:hypothetical protein
LGHPAGAAAAALAVTALAGCGSGDSTVAKTPETPGPPTSAGAAPSGTAAPPTSSAPPADPCAVNLAAPAIAKAVSELPRDPRSQQPWNPEPLAGNYSECAELSAVIVKANTNAEHPGTRAVLFHLGQYIPQAVPDTYGFNGIDLARSTADTVALEHAGGLQGLNSVVKFHWNGTDVEIVGNTAG